MRGFLYKIFTNVAEIFWGRNLLWHFLAIALTFIFVISGFDWFYFQVTRGAGLQAFLFPAVLLGAFVPIFGIFVFFIISFFGRNKLLINTSFALAQAALLGLLISDFYKIFTGRTGPPEFFGSPLGLDISHEFRFGFLRGGIFFGWPSSHTTVAFAMAVTLIMLFPKNKMVKYISLLYALYIGLGVSMTIHWFSDFAAGAIFGTAIGTVVGKSFWKRYYLRKDNRNIAEATQERLVC